MPRHENTKFDLPEGSLAALGSFADSMRPAGETLARLAGLTEPKQTHHSILADIAKLESRMTPVVDAFARVNELASGTRASTLANLAKIQDAPGPIFEPISRLDLANFNVPQDIMPTHVAPDPLNKLKQQIADQREAIVGLRNARSRDLSPPVSPELRLPPNPIFETNKHLKNIQKRFDRLEEIALEGAAIATNLQAYAADFLVKFESAASGNTKAARKAIWLGAIAIVIALAMPVAQIIHAEFWRAPADIATTAKITQEIRDEVDRLRAAYEVEIGRLRAETSDSGDRAARLLEQIRDRLIAAAGTP